MMQCFKHGPQSSRACPVVAGRCVQQGPATKYVAAAMFVDCTFAELLKDRRTVYSPYVDALYPRLHQSDLAT